MINIDDLEKIIQVVGKYSISRFEFQHEESKVIIEKQGIDKNVFKQGTEDENAKDNIEHLQSAVKENKATYKFEDMNLEEADIKKEYIKANFAGTFYSKKDSEGPAFVNLYDEVKSNTVVGLLEVMKLFNEVEAGIEGTIVDILVKDGEFVEYGQPLFEVKAGENYV